jgi:exopolyphosphatase/pppGpp-phosphohydrolase
MSDFQKAKQYVFNLLGSDLSRHFIYHDLSHTLDVYKASTRLGEMAQLDDSEMLLLQTAALFHDVGMVYQVDMHEEKSAEVVREILPSFGYSNEDIDIIVSMILATKLPQTPTNRLAELLCDADLDYLGRDDFFLNGAKLHLEWQRMKIRDVSFDEWISIEKSFLLSHLFFSKEAQKLRNEGKQRNLNQLESICEFGRGT